MIYVWKALSYCFAISLKIWSEILRKDLIYVFSYENMKNKHLILCTGHKDDISNAQLPQGREHCYVLFWASSCKEENYFQEGRSYKQSVACKLMLTSVNSNIVEECSWKGYNAWGSTMNNVLYFKCLFLLLCDFS